MSTPHRSARPASLAAVLRPSRRDAEALRLSLVLVIAVMRAEVFTPEHQPISDDSGERWAWLRDALAPLTAHSHTIAAILPLLVWDDYVPVWDNPRRLGVTIDALARRAVKLGRSLSRRSAA